VFSYYPTNQVSIYNKYVEKKINLEPPYILQLAILYYPHDLNKIEIKLK